MFEANDDRHFNRRDPYIDRQSVKITTLHGLCTDLLHTTISETEFLDRDAMESKALQTIYVNEAFEEAMSNEYPTHKRFLSRR